MKINQIIREKRKELSLTQEQIAELLGVSTPAVNKWEKGSTYPDITLLPALARLLKIDLNREEQLAILYHKQKKYEDAEKIWEHRVLKGVTDIQTALINMLEIALLEKCNDNAEFFADMYKTITRQFCFPEWMRYNAHLLLAIDKKNKDECLSILKKMLPAMKKEWNVQDCQLYRNAKDSESTLFSSRLADTLCDELATKEEYAFVRDCIEFRELMAEMRS